MRAGAARSEGSDARAAPDPGWLACPRDHGLLAASAEGLKCEAGHRFPLRSFAGRSYADFIDAPSLDATAELQRSTYEAETNRYMQEGRGAKREFMRWFVSQRLHGRVKSKERLILSALRSLSLPPRPRLLELGCNDGRYLNVASALHGGAGLGLDLSETAIRQALEALPPESSSAFHRARADQLPVVDRSVDCVLSFDVFEHLGQAAFARALAECARVLRPGGWLVVYIVSQKDRFTLHETLRQVSGGRIGVDDGEGHRYENFIHPDRFREVASEVGFAVTRLRAYHGFWTLFAEYYLYNAVPRFGYALLELLDYPLTRFEHGNGFLAVAQREDR